MSQIKRREIAEALGHGTADKRLEILRRVGEAGSISQAAREAGVSYKAAWQALDTLSNLAGAALVERAVGGAGGGGARLTPAGSALLQAAAELARVRDSVLARLAAGTGHAAGALSLRTSMRNQLPCTVLALRPGAPGVLAELGLPGGLGMQARITRESAQLLGLRKGLPVLALCKAAAVELAPVAKRGEARNLLAGTVARAARGEVVLSLPGGLQLVGFAATGWAVRRGDTAVACVDPTAMVLALG